MEKPIITQRVDPPVPSRDYDWSAIRDGYELGNLMGWGRTERAAIDDLLDQEEER